MTIDLNGSPVPVQVARSQRKTMEMRLEGGLLFVRAPRYMEDDAVKEVLLRHQKKLSGAYIRAREQALLQAPASFLNGSQYPYLGGVLTLKVEQVDGTRARVFQKVSDLVIQTPDISQETVKMLLTGWYRQMANRLIRERVAHYQPMVGETVNRITIKEQKSRWGSCSTMHNLNFNWHLLEYPLEVVDYVVVHELCHLLHMDHTKQFWAQVERILPDYKSRQSALQKH